jgi:parvulin-like peptidyl-prolyl isomerase
MSYAELVELQKIQLIEGKLQTKLGKTAPTYETKVRASHILVKSKTLAEQLLRRAKSGENFAALAKKYSTDPGSAKKGGDLGYFTKGTMVAPFSNAAFSMKIGEIRLVHSQFGWHIIKVTGRERAKLTSTELQQAQQSAYTSWLTRQQAVIGVQKYVSGSQLPGQDLVPTVNPLTNPVTVPSPAPVTTPLVPPTPAFTPTGKKSSSSSNPKPAATAKPKK